MSDKPYCRPLSVLCYWANQLTRGRNAEGQNNFKAKWPQFHWITGSQRPTGMCLNVCSFFSLFIGITAKEILEPGFIEKIVTIF